MDNQGLFEIDDNGLLVVNKIETRKIPEFKKILIRDKGSEGDYDGRNKFFAFKEFMYIYLVSDPKSTLRDLPLKDRKVKAKHKSELPIDWKEDDTIKDAIVAYENELKLSGIEYAYYNASRGIYAIGKDIELFNESNDLLRERIKELRNELDNPELLPDQKEEKTLQLSNNIETLTSNTQEIIKLNNILPKSYQALEDLYKKMREEASENSKVYGGGSLGNREE